MDQLYLAHHGIKGQRWGIKHGPPYPLDDDDKSRAELNAQKSKASEKKFWTDDRKRMAKRIAIGTAVVAGVAAAGYIGYKSGAFDSFAKSGKAVLDSSIADVGAVNAEIIDTIPRIGKSVSQIDVQMVNSINAGNSGVEGTLNCGHTSMAYVLNSVFGKSVTAKGFSGVDEVSGLRGGRHKGIFDAAFEGIKHVNPPFEESFEQSVKRIRPGSTGVLFVMGKRGGHFLNFECDYNGSLALIDSQVPGRNKIFRAGSRLYEIYTANLRIDDIMDFTDASIRDGADSIFRYCVNGG